MAVPTRTKPEAATVARRISAKRQQIKNNNQQLQQQPQNDQNNAETHYGVQVINVPSQPSVAQTTRTPHNVVGNPAELDFHSNSVKQFHATWDLIESGAYGSTIPLSDLSFKHQPHHQKSGSTQKDDPMIEITFNAIKVAVPAEHPITLENLGLSSNHHLFIDDAFVKTTREGETRVTAKAGMKVVAERYPSMQPVNWLYWMWGNYVPDRKQIAHALQSPWGRTLVNGFNSLLLSLLARPGINLSAPPPSPAQLILTVISSGKMLDLMLKDTLLRLLTDASLNFAHVLVSLAICELCFIIAASVNVFACARLIEYHIIPALFFTWTVILPAIHRAWVLAAPLAQKHGRATGFVVLVLPITLLVALFAFDVSWRVSVNVDGLRTCALIVPLLDGGPLLAKRSERVML
ncbi:hypothetical protein DFJ77DRAFT_222842 [Powellomyces hirtus]|nr:hypothetical protein DFJ77DRAFT_222842 [Powellomyces hirtus]